MLHGFLDLGRWILIPDNVDGLTQAIGGGSGNGSANADASAPFNGTLFVHGEGVGIIRHQPILGLQHIRCPSVKMWYRTRACNVNPFEASGIRYSNAYSRLASGSRRLSYNPRWPVAT